MNEVFKVGKEMVVLDPNPEAIPFLESVSPGFSVASIRPPVSFIPNFQKAVNFGRLDNNYEKALGALYSCELCGHRCKVNRFRERGRCGLSDKIQYAAPFVHIAEEPVINPAVNVKFLECSMSCVYCVRHCQKNSEILSFDIESFWKRIGDQRRQNPGICSLEFCGGEPSIYLPWVLSWLKNATEHMNLPVVWNCNLFATQQALELLDGVVDVYLPDFAFGNDACAKRLGGVNSYVEAAVNGLESMVAQNAKTIVRILVLPGHVECCHKKAIDVLSRFRDSIFISILDQYVPVHLASKHPDIYRRPGPEEIQAVEEYALKKGLKNVLDANDFWTK